jgi:hypothetical protein
VPAGARSLHGSAEMCCTVVVTHLVTQGALSSGIEIRRRPARERAECASASSAKTFHIHGIRLLARSGPTRRALPEKRFACGVQPEAPAMQATFMLPRAAPNVAYSAAEGKVYGAEYFLKAALAGGICCSITHGALTPVDVVKTRMQLDPVTYNRGMIAGFGQVFTPAASAGSRNPPRN